jgi:hypothetical protein
VLSPAPAGAAVRAADVAFARFDGGPLFGEDLQGDHSVGAVGDLDLDGRPELLAAAAGARYGGQASGSVFVLRAPAG